MADVSIPLKTAEDGLPAICAMTGERADGAMAMKVGRTLTRWKAPEVRIPLSEPVFKKWSQRQNIHIKGRGIASVLTAIGVVLAFRSPIAAFSVLGVAIAIHLLDLWAERSVTEYRPDLERHGSELHLRRVHPRFASALVEMGAQDLPEVG